MTKVKYWRYLHWRQKYPHLLSIGGEGGDGYESSHFLKYWRGVRPWVDTKVSKLLAAVAGGVVTVREIISIGENCG